MLVVETVLLVVALWVVKCLEVLSVPFVFPVVQVEGAVPRVGLTVVLFTVTGLLVLVLIVVAA